MATRDIRPSTPHTICDVCGRTLLRGERAEAYVHVGERRWVCELCKPRVLHEGWVREGTAPDYDNDAGAHERRRSLLGRLRRRDSNGQQAPTERRAAPATPEPSGPYADLPQAWDPAREPRHVRAVPTSPEHKMVSALELFNASEHVRTVAGVARSLGLPVVSVIPSSARPSLVQLVVSWELCGYRYDIELSDEVGNVRLAGQGYELDELSEDERHANTTAADDGTLTLA